MTYTPITATEARRKFFDLIKGATERHEVYHINHRKGSLVLLSEEDYESLLETLSLLSIPGFAQSIKKSVKQMEKGETYSLNEVFGSEG